MITWHRKLSCALTLAATVVAVTAHAQWLRYPTAGVPKRADGRPNLDAPAPRAANGRPDLSGLWQLAGSCPADGCIDYIVGPEFQDIGAKLPGGLPYQPWAAQLVKERSAQLGRDDPVSACRPGGGIRMLTLPPPRKILQLPG